LLLATCVTGQGAARYVIPSAYMVIFGAGLVAAWTVQRYRALAAGCIVLLAGLFSTGNIIRQTLSYHQIFHEFRDAIAYLDQRGKKGVTLAYDSPALPPEEATNLRLYLEKYGPLYYGTEPRTIVAAEDFDFRPQRLSILTQRDFRPIQTFSASIGLSVCDSVYIPFREAGLLEDAARTVTGIEAFFRLPSRSYWDTGTMPIRHQGRFVIYELCDQDEPKSFGGPKVDINLGTMAVDAGKTRIQLPPTDLPDIGVFEMDCPVEVVSGRAMFGLREVAGQTLWSTPLRVGTGQLAAPPVLVRSPEKRYEFFLDRGQRFVMRMPRGCRCNVLPISKFEPFMPETAS